jgi:hypothetical protein
MERLAGAVKRIWPGPRSVLGPLGFAPFWVWQLACAKIERAHFGAHQCARQLHTNCKESAHQLHTNPQVSGAQTLRSLGRLERPVAGYCIAPAHIQSPSNSKEQRATFCKSVGAQVNRRRRAHGSAREGPFSACLPLCLDWHAAPGKAVSRVPGVDTTSRRAVGATWPESERQCQISGAVGSVAFGKKGRKTRAISRAEGATLPNATYGTVSRRVRKWRTHRRAIISGLINPGRIGFAADRPWRVRQAALQIAGTSQGHQEPSPRTFKGCRQKAAGGRSFLDCQGRDECNGLG